MQTDVLQGTLDMLVLKALSLESTHGWGIAQHIGRLSRDVLVINQGSLYPALQRLERKGLISARWGESENNRKAKFYALTAAGRRHLGDEAADWQRFVAAVQMVMASA
ncbi:MAG: PadR family transcriptional regulator [Gemmatimonadetes bacterium]|nr:PadR family transcriptional regulator [Gemmatimonadota bacterium]